MQLSGEAPAPRGDQGVYSWELPVDEGWEWSCAALQHSPAGPRGLRDALARQGLCHSSRAGDRSHTMAQGVTELRGHHPPWRGLDTNKHSKSHLSTGRTSSRGGGRALSSCPERAWGSLSGDVPNPPGWVGLDALQRPLPTPPLLRFCELVGSHS